MFKIELHGLKEIMHFKYISDKSSLISLIQFVTKTN
jgi:hypothetical protein